MKLINTEKRKDWKQKVEALGFSFHSLTTIYWDESHAYEFEMDEILLIEKATNELHQMCIQAAQHVIDNKLYHLFKIPEKFIPIIEKSWEDDAPSVNGRFDFSFNNGKLKMLEYNADTPTSLLESSVIQWYWLQDFNPELDQFNSIHEKLIDYWKYVKPYLNGNGKVHFASIDAVEDVITVEYLRDTATQAGLETEFLLMDEIGVYNDGNLKYFIDKNELKIDNIYKLYPWEWMIREEFGDDLLSGSNPLWIEPAWKMILSNKAILPILWKLFPDNEYLLPSYFEEENILTHYVKKPILAREGANIQIVNSGSVIEETKGDYGAEGFICQQYCRLPEFEGKKALIGSWMISQEAAGMGVRESDSLITGNLSRYVPHYINSKIKK